MLKTALCRQLGMEYPIFSVGFARMAGPDLAAAVSNAGGLGFIGAAYLSPEQIAQAARDVKSKTTQPFGINLFAPSAPASSFPSPDVAIRRVAPYFSELGLPAPSLPELSAFSYPTPLRSACSLRIGEGNQSMERRGTRCARSGRRSIEGHGKSGSEGVRCHNS